MDIRIDTLRLRNFKGVRDAEFAFDGRNSTIEGENGVGKSTVFDAFTWLLFGKDHNGLDQTNFDIKPIDPDTREPIHHLEHSVEAVLLIDGNRRTFKREWRENWIKPRGETEMIMKGHDSHFFVDGVDVATKSAYDAVIHTLVDEDVFKMITNPLFFIDDRYTSWKERRKVILSLVGGADGSDALRAEFADLIAEMKGDAMDTFKKRLAAAKKSNRQELEKAISTIDALQKVVAVEVDVADVTAERDAIISERDEVLSALQGKISAIDAKISDLNAANADAQAALDAKYARISALRAKMGQSLVDAEKAAQSDDMLAKKAYFEARGIADQAAQALQRLEGEVAKARADYDDAVRCRADEAAKLARLGRDHAALKEQSFSYEPTTICPACGRPLPEEDVEKATELAHAAFLERINSGCADIIAQARAVKEEIAAWDETIEARKAAADKCGVELLQGQSALKAARDAEAQLCESLGPQLDLRKVDEQVMRSPAYVEMAEEVRRLQAEVDKAAGSSVGVDALLAERKIVEAEYDSKLGAYARRIAPLEDHLAVAREHDRVRGLISEEEEKRKAFADEVARLERLEFRTGEYVKASVDAVEDAINSLFSVARWKMFDRTLDGAVVEMCEVTDAKGVPFRSMNDAMKILCGMDVIRVFSTNYGSYAPVFIDNAESITRREFDTPAQVIRLVVSEGKALTMSNE